MSAFREDRESPRMFDKGAKRTAEAGRYLTGPFRSEKRCTQTFT
jgi:hypothetical protein